MRHNTTQRPKRNRYQELAEELSTLLGVEVSPVAYDLGYWCRIARHEHPKNAKYITHGLEQSAQRGWDAAERDLDIH